MLVTHIIYARHWIINFCSIWMRFTSVRMQCYYTAKVYSSLLQLPDINVGVHWQPTLCVDNQRICIFVTVYWMVSMFYNTVNFLAIKNEWLHFRHTCRQLLWSNYLVASVLFIYLLMFTSQVLRVWLWSYSLPKLHHIMRCLCMKSWRYYIRCMCLKIC